MPTKESQDRRPTNDVAPHRASRLMSWPYGCLVLLVSGLALLSLPARLEGPHLFTISVGHSISALDLVGIVPLLVGSFWLHVGLWRRRGRLEEWVRDRPGRATGVLCVAALGLGLLLASAFSDFFWWWAVGAALFAGMHVPVLLAALRKGGTT